MVLGACVSNGVRVGSLEERTPRVWEDCVDAEAHKIVTVMVEMV